MQRKRDVPRRKSQSCDCKLRSYETHAYAHFFFINPLITHGQSCLNLVKWNILLGGNFEINEMENLKDESVNINNTAL